MGYIQNNVYNELLRPIKHFMIRINYLCITDSLYKHVINLTFIINFV